jgi:FlaG/FlaF family flagellin (archaellin)
MKGISEVLAVLMMVVISVSLIGVVWYFISGATKKGSFSILDLRCTAGNPGEIRIVASYNGADATPADVTVRIENVITGTSTVVTNPSIFKGTNCNVDTIGSAACNQPASATARITSGETVGIRVSYTVSSGQSARVTLIVFGTPSGMQTVTCY